MLNHDTIMVMWVPFNLAEITKNLAWNFKKTIVLSCFRKGNIYLNDRREYFEEATLKDVLCIHTVLANIFQAFIEMLPGE